MLVQHRGINESLVIGKAGDVLTGPIVVTVCHAKKLHCRLGVTAQRNIGVFRAETLPLLPVEDHETAANLIGPNLPVIGTGAPK